MSEAEAQRLLKEYPEKESAKEKQRFPLLAAYDFCLKCSHLFNVLDARGAISTTERAGIIGRVRKMACKVAELWLDQSRAGVAAEESAI